jgi:hypothetical protein
MIIAGVGGSDRQPARADPAVLEPMFIEPRDFHQVATLAGVDKLAVADIDAVVAEAIEEHDVARLQFITRDWNPELVLPHRAMRE